MRKTREAQSALNEFDLYFTSMNGADGGIYQPAKEIDMEALKRGQENAAKIWTPEAVAEVLGTGCREPMIAQSIRNAAINWPQFLGDVECEIINSFCGDWTRTGFLNSDIRAYLSGFYGTDGIVRARTFMLFVAEALE